jgi:hypothetical protein
MYLGLTLCVEVKTYSCLYVLDLTVGLQGVTGGEVSTREIGSGVYMMLARSF